MCICTDCSIVSFAIFFFNDTATTEIYTLSLHDALPIFLRYRRYVARSPVQFRLRLDRKRLYARQRGYAARRSEEHTSELQSPDHLVCRLLLEKKKIERSFPLILTNLNRYVLYRDLFILI